MRLAPWRFDPVTCLADLDAIEQLLTAHAELSERDDILPFFRAHPQLAASLGSYSLVTKTYDRLGLAVTLFGQFTADLVAGDRRNRAYCLVEFEDGRSNSVRKWQRASCMRCRAVTPGCNHTPQHESVVQWKVTGHPRVVDQAATAMPAPAGVAGRGPFPNSVIAEGYTHVPASG